MRALAPLHTIDNDTGTCSQVLTRSSQHVDISDFRHELDTIFESVRIRRRSRNLDVADRGDRLESRLRVGRRDVVRERLRMMIAMVHTK